jgi:uncharacterized protein YdhG (YjbR/CyaY superfamily)
MAKSGKSQNEGVFTDQELAAMQEAKKERKKGKKADGLADLLAKIEEMDGSDRQIAEKLHALVTAHAPALAPKTWYGMPAWADENGKAVCFFTPAGKFSERYATFGFNPNAKLDEGNMWPTSFAVLKIGPAEEKRIIEMITRALGA